jgi:hypothetical protein
MRKAAGTSCSKNKEMKDSSTEKKFFRVFRVFRGKIWVLLFMIPRDLRNREGL